ncbi:MAG: mandelate racemase/muconate lactonizing enzyme family protein [Candidatus Njordarchaeales archaeon]
MGHKIRDVRLFILDVRLQEPFAISFKTFTHAENFLVVVETEDGLVGYGEGAPFKPITGDSREEALDFAKRVAKELKGFTFTDVREVHEALNKIGNELGFTSQTVLAAIDMAIYDILGKSKNVPVYKILGAEKPHLVPNTLTIGIKPIDKTVESAKKLMSDFKENGLKRIKLKLSGDLKSDIERVLAVAKVFPGEFTLDANQGYKDPEDAVKLVKKLYNELGDRIILLEEPCPKGDIEKMKYVKDRSEIPIFADESAATVEDARRVAEAGAADGINIKLQKAGGIYYGLKIAEIAKEHNLKLMVGCMLETGISIAAGIHFATAIKEVINTDLDSDLTLGINILKEIHPFKDGCRVPLEAPGLGIEPLEIIKNIINEDLRLLKA